MLRQVGEHSEFSISREDCAREGLFAPPPDRERLLVFVDYRLPDVELYPYVSPTYTCMWARPQFVFVNVYICMSTPECSLVHP